MIKNQKDLAAEKVWELMADRLLYCVESGECQNFDNGVCTSCDRIKLIGYDSGVQNRLIEASVEYNYYNAENRTLFLQGINLQGLIVKRRKRWSLELHIERVFR